jgi:hypothetical protein
MYEVSHCDETWVVPAKYRASWALDSQQSHFKGQDVPDQVDQKEGPLSSPGLFWVQQAVMHQLQYGGVLCDPIVQVEGSITTCTTISLLLHGYTSGQEDSQGGGDAHFGMELCSYYSDTIIIIKSY